MPDIFDQVSTQKKDIFDRVFIPKEDIFDKVMGLGEGALTTALGATTWIPQGIANVADLGAAALAGQETTFEMGKNVAEYWNYEPKKEVGKTITGAVQYPFKKLEEGQKWTGEKVYDVTGSPVLASGAETLVGSIPFVAGGVLVKGAKSIVKVPTNILKGIEQTNLAKLRGERVGEFANVPIKVEDVAIPETSIKPIIVTPQKDTSPINKIEPITTSQETQQSKTGVRNEIVDKERQARGVEPIEQPKVEATNFETIKAKVDSGEIDPFALTDKINAEVAKNGKIAPLGTEDIQILGYHKAKLIEERTKIQSAREEAIKNGDAEEELATIDQLVEIEKLQTANEKATKANSSAWGHSGLEMQNEIAQDFSISRMIQTRKENKGGIDVTPFERKQLEEYARKIEESNAKIATYEKKMAEQADIISSKEANHTFQKLKDEVAYEKRVQKRAYSKTELAVEYEQLSKDFTAKLGGLHSGIDPTIAPEILKITKNRIKSGLVTVEAIVDDIYMLAKNAGHELSKRDIRDTISGYGVAKGLSRDEVLSQLREVKRQGKLISKIEDAQSGKRPFKGSFPKDEKTKIVAELEKQLKAEMDKQGFEKGLPEETRLATWKKRTTEKMKELEEKMRTGNFDKIPRVKKELTLDQEAIDLGFERDQLIRSYKKVETDVLLERRNLLQKSLDIGKEVLGLSRAIKTSIDLSAVLRQGAFIALGHPVRGLKAMPFMFKALRSEKGQFAVEQEIMKRPTYDLMNKSGLYLSEHGASLNKMEEAYMSHWGEHIPGVAASGRAYTTYLNRLRADSFDAMIKNLPKVEGKINPTEMQTISNYINVATGRGTMKPGTALGAINSVFFAPRYVLSRFQLLYGQPIFNSLGKGSPKATKMIAKEYARFFVGLSVVYALGAAMGGKLEPNPASSDFGKIRFGDTRIDPMAGMAQTSTFLYRATSGKIKKPGEGTSKLDGAKYWEVYSRFARYKLAPIPGLAIDIQSGRDVVGQKIKPVGNVKDFMEGKSIPSNLVMPLALSDIYQTMVEQGVPAGSAMALLSIFGMGMQTYDQRR